MKIKYKVSIIITITVFIYYPITPIVALSCKELTDNTICFDIAKLRLHNPNASYIWNQGGVGKWSDSIQEPSFDEFLQDNVYFFIFFLTVPASVIFGLVMRDRNNQRLFPQ